MNDFDWLVLKTPTLAVFLLYCGVMDNGKNNSNLIQTYNSDNIPSPI